jgi:hypothetical protein
VGRLAENIAKPQLRPEAPVEIKQKVIDFWHELLSAFFGVEDEPAICGLAEDLAATVPYWLNGTPAVLASR